MNKRHVPSNSDDAFFKKPKKSVMLFLQQTAEWCCYYSFTNALSKMRKHVYIKDEKFFQTD
ncbi:hypothetical protein SAMN05192533_105220 [Mesobacillus persicus]|uniref:Uncharacterized protein n=1 Tax=Mesobacillus persicus TaxID=930146 RepID=A0A1H8B021_9BACI|nr:hypothetical protein [Mesobacillus persicus]SEM76103.1 hypothetical protein SAMN05192533_105220 [Mesobacillus persicus]